MNENLKNFLEELKQAGYNEVEYEEEDNAIDFSKCKRRTFELDDIDEEEYGIEDITFILGDNFNFSCIEINELDIKAGNNCTIHVQEGEASIIAGNNCNITLAFGYSLIVGSENNLECVYINDIVFGDNNHIEVEELINNAKGGNNNNIIIKDDMEEIRFKDTKIDLGIDNNVKIGKLAINMK